MDVSNGVKDRFTHLTRSVAWIDYVIAVAVVFGTVGVAFAVHQLMPHASLALLFLTSVVIVSSRTGLGPSLLASMLSFLAYNFFFTSPYYTFKVADAGELATLVFFLVMATITGNLAARMRQEIAQRQVSLLRISNLYDFSRRLSLATSPQQVLDALAAHLAQSLECPVVVYLAGANADPAAGLQPKAQAGATESVPNARLEAAWLQGFTEPTLIDNWQLFNLTVNQGAVGMVAMGTALLEKEQLMLVRNLCDQATVALERTRLQIDLEKERLISETEQLRSALLSSVSHDLRTPLASIIGSTTSLLEYGGSFSEQDRNELLTTVVDEAQRLDRHIQNLLDMTRLGKGKVSLRRDWVDLNDIVSGALHRLQSALKDGVLDIDIPPSLPLLWVHGALIEQALVNLLDNAIRFSPDGGRISITVGSVDDRIEISLCDDGPGIPDAEKEKIFDMFYTSQQGDRSNRRGTGLGLAICRGMLGAHGGTVTAQDGAGGRGTCMRISLPLVQPAAGDTQ